MAGTFAPFPIQPQLTAIAVAYQNGAMIADAVMPRTPVATQQFEYLRYVKEERFTIPDTGVGRTSAPNRVEFGATEDTATTTDRALDDPVPQADILNAPPNFDPLAVATEGIMELIGLDREKRVADIVFDGATYPTGNKVTLAGTSRWSQSGSDPIDDILAAKDAMMAMPNILVLGTKTWRHLRQHPDVAKAIQGNSGDRTVAARGAVADLLELEELLIGEAWVNPSKPGQTPTYSRLWGHHAALLRRDPTATTRRGVTFAITPQWGTQVAGSIDDPDIGMRGGQRVRAGESVTELVIASDAGYFFENAGDDS